jgi:hypothetical protein
MNIICSNIADVCHKDVPIKFKHGGRHLQKILIRLHVCIESLKTAQLLKLINDLANQTSKGLY